MRIAILGCGVMGSSFATQLSKKHEIFLFDRNKEKTEKLAGEIGARGSDSLSQAILRSELVLLAVKPKDIEQLASQVSPFLTEEHLLVSILAGASLKKLRTFFPKGSLFRMMPNLPLLCNEGILAIAQEKMAPKGLQEEISSLFHDLGKVLWVQEEEMDAITSLAGSGPAFFYICMEAMIASGIEMGLSAQASKELVEQMISGSLKLLHYSDTSPLQLVSQIASPGGTTVAGLTELENASVRQGIMKAFLAAFRRSQELRG